MKNIRKARKIKTQLFKTADSGQLDLFVKIPGLDETIRLLEWLRCFGIHSARN